MSQRGPGDDQVDVDGIVAYWESKAEEWEYFRPQREAQSRSEAWNEAEDNWNRGGPGAVSPAWLASPDGREFLRQEVAGEHELLREERQEARRCNDAARERERTGWEAGG